MLIRNKKKEKKRFLRGRGCQSWATGMVRAFNMKTARNLVFFWTAIKGIKKTKTKQDSRWQQRIHEPGPLNHKKEMPRSEMTVMTNCEICHVSF